MSIYSKYDHQWEFWGKVRLEDIQKETEINRFPSLEKNYLLFKSKWTRNYQNLNQIFGTKLRHGHSFCKNLSFLIRTRVEPQNERALRIQTFHTV